MSKVNCNGGSGASSVLFAASECAPFIKTGGLADVAAALPIELAASGMDARVVLPLYRAVRERWGAELEQVCAFTVPLGWRNQYCGVKRLVYRGVTYYFIDNEYYFNRDYIYGVFNCDEAERFGFFSKATLEMLPHVGFFPNALHLNDWQTAMAAPLLKLQYADKPGYGDIGTVLTIHNLRFQGVFDRAFADELLSLGPPAFDTGKLEYYGCVNYLKGGIVYADSITTVSPTYAREIKTRFYGESLEGVLESRGDALVGVLNGIDTLEFDPAADESLPARYCLDDMAGKAACKAALQRELGLAEDPDAAVIGVVSRLTGQKGFDLVERVLGEIMEKPVQLAVLGTGENRYERLFGWAQGRYPGRVAARLEYNEGLARRIYAGADLFLMPSQFEPCGLTQMIAMRYGAVPIVRETGGLKDTVTPYNRFEDSGTGFSFLNYNAHELLFTVQHAADYFANKPLWARLVRRAMEGDFSWKASAARYREIYGTNN